MGFYSELQPLHDYGLMIETRFYVDLPEDWLLILTDVKGSTKAIEAGRYKEVNMIGVSCIVAVQNALGDVEFPFIFGGDGATLAIPPEYGDQAREALSHTRKMARQQFGLDLRIATIPAQLIRAKGAHLKVAKLCVSQGNHIALMRGEGWSIAESMMKEREAEFGLPEDYPSGGDHDGLECRWNPVPARKSEILALIVQSRMQGEAALGIYRGILGEILQPDLKPISLANLPFEWPPRSLWSEAKIREPNWWKRALYLLKGYSLTLLFTIILRLRGKKNQTSPIPYLSELTQNTDYVKFDECLRMIIDVSLEQKSRLLQILEDHVSKGEIFYGAHSDPHALMTCFIQGPTQHLHFVDAGGGGYAMAAKQLKAQRLSARSDNKL